MESNAFASLATIRLPSPCRLLPSACCPDKDLIVLISRLGGHDKLSLWKLQGSKKWGIDVGEDNNAPATVAALVWSPSGQTIAAVRDSAHITLHSVQDGRVERCLSIPLNQSAVKNTRAITGVWWLAGHHSASSDVIPDIFKRNGVKTGSALSILKMLPLLDPLKERDEALTATDLFAFQGTQTRVTSQQSTPAVIKQWPVLVPFPEDASMVSPSHNLIPQDKIEESRSSTQAQEDEDSLLILVDEQGVLHCFLDGSYFLGSVALPDGLPSTTLFKHPRRPLIFLHPQPLDSDLLAARIRPLVIDMPLLTTPEVRDFARLSSAARELMWYIMRVVSEVRESWFGSESFTGAKDIGVKWVQALERRLREQYGDQSPNVILDLTALLVTGHCGSEGLADFISSSEQNSERNLQKWDSTVTESLMKMRDYASTRIIPALQRLHIILSEVLGWSYMPQFRLLNLSTDYVDSCLRMIERGIFISSWLAAEARRELGAFKQFLSFIRHETIVANPSTESHTNPDHDILEVNGYLMSGLMTSKIDGWFTGPLPQFNPGDLGLWPPHNSGKTLDEMMQLARAALQDPSQTSWQPKVPSNDHAHLDKNLEALVQEVAPRCQRVFAEASQGVARSATVSVDGGATAPQAKSVPTEITCHFVRQRVISNQNEPDHQLEYLATHVGFGGRAFLCVSRMPYDRCVAGAHDDEIGVCLLESSVEEAEVEVLEAEFFDDETLILVYQDKDSEDAIFVATVEYTTLGYEMLERESYVSGPARIDMMAQVVERWKGGHFSCDPIPIKKSRRLCGFRDGSVSVAVNGRVGRRVVCVLNGGGTKMEVLDMEGEEQEGEEEMEVVGG